MGHQADPHRAAAWDALSRAWADGQGETGDANQKWIINPSLFRLLGDVDGLRVLDAACGGGHIARELARRGAAVTAIDISAGMIDLARTRATLSAPAIRFLVGDIAAMPQVADAGFDVVVCSMALMNVGDAANAFAEFARALTPGGRLVFSLPHPCYPRVKGGRGVFVADAAGEEWLEDYRVADYQTEGPYEVEIPADDSETGAIVVPTFHRTLSTYVSHLVSAGFVVDGLVEPAPPDAEAAKRELGLGWWDATRRITYYLVIAARRAFAPCQ